MFTSPSSSRPAHVRSHRSGPSGLLSTALLVASALPLAPAAAQDIHKCLVDGKLSYSDRPCPQSATSASTLARQAAPPADPAAAASLTRMRKEALALEKSRLAREDQQAKQDAKVAQAAAVRQRRCDKLRLQRQWADDDARRASGSNSDAARTRARRAADLLALECGR
ncbi:DUF4124 domain-containing protein [Duganella sp. Leaf126]|uniref:DUF4124 domain-containing protein n=1 Tax=Duganella sp. Leaf126 TaxID=1736266 RepID=UPI0012E14096|nr:DUF4124 domain-containing protein [Duganella sp. Leaf126]